jgi:hypothetical protein
MNFSKLKFKKIKVSPSIKIDMAAIPYLKHLPD